MLLLFAGLQQIIQAFLWMLIHSLWQGVLAAALAIVIIQLTKKTSSPIRYNLLLCTIALFVLASAFTFIYELRNSIKDENTNGSTVSKNTILYKSVSSTSGYYQKPIDSFLVLEDVTNKYANYIVSTWFIFFLFHCIKLISGLSYIRSLSRKNIYPAEDKLLMLLGQLKDQLNLTRPVRLLLSSKINTPVVIGAIKPVILIPVGILCNLSLLETEAILLHELAHIKRNDFLSNLIQTIVDNIFFFNPALIWISSRLREEREVCCDDIALNHLNDSDSYVNALMKFHEVKPAAVSFGMAIGGKRFQLLHRITRIINKENYKASFMENTVLFFTVISLSALGFISGKLPTHKQIQKNLITEVSNNRQTINPQLNLNQKSFSIAKDTVPAKQRKKEVRQTDKNQISITEDDGKKYTITKKDGEIESIMEDGKPVAKEDYPKYEKIMRDMEDREATLENARQEVIQKKIELDEKRAELLQQNKQLKDELLNNKLRMKEKMDVDERMMLKQKMLLENNELTGKEKEMSLLRENSHMMANQIQMQKKMEALQRENLKKTVMDKNHAYLLEKEVLMKQEKNQLLAGKMDFERKQLDQLKMQLEFENKRKIDFAFNNNGEIGSIIADLIAEKIIENSDPLSFTLNNQELIVNGKKQSEEIFNKLKERYIHNKSDSFQYSHNKNSTSTTINRE